MNKAQKVAWSVNDKVAVQAEEISEFLHGMGFEDVSVHFGHMSREDYPGTTLDKHLFRLSVDAKVVLPGAEAPSASSPNA